MRLLQIDPNGSETTALDFHPMVTVVTGLTPSGRDIVMRVARSLGRATDPGSGGLLEAHGVLLDLNRDTLELLELRADVDVLVSDADLPPGPRPADEPDEAIVDDAAVEEADAEHPRSREDVERFIETTPFGLDADLDQARRRRSDSRQALEILQEAAAKAQVEFDKVLGRQKMAEAELAAAREATGPLLRLVSGDDAERDESAEPPVDPHQIIRQRGELTEKITQLEQRIASHTRGLDELSAIDTRPLIVLLDAIRHPQPIEYVPSDRAIELADEVIDLERKVADLEKELDKRGLASGAALKQLEVCRSELAAAEKAMKKPELTPEDVTELEAAHEAVLEAEDKATGAFKRGGQKRLEQALAKQQEILDRIGFPTWSSYVMGAGLLAIDHAAEQRLEKSRLDMEAAESHWAAVCEEIEANPEHRRLLDRLEEVYLEAFDLLGGAEPDDLETALRELEVPKREVTAEELTDALAYQLELAGLQLPDGAGADLTIMAAEAFIEEASAVEGRIAELRDERATAEAELTVARGQLQDLPEVELPDEPLPSEPEPGEVVDAASVSDDPWSGFESEPVAGEGVAKPPAATGFETFDPSDPFGLGGLGGGEQPPEPSRGDQGAAPADADGETVGHRSASPEEIERLEQAVETAREEVTEYTEWVESRQALVDAALTVETIASSRLQKLAAELMDTMAPYGSADDGNESGSVTGAGSNGRAPAAPPLPADVEHYLSGRVDAQRRLSYAGSLPIVLNDALHQLQPTDVRRVLDHLQTMSESVQVIYLSDDSTVAGWAEEVGFQRAAVVPAPIGFG